MKKIIVSFTLILLIVGITTVCSLASMNELTSYNTTTKQYIDFIHNHTYSPKTAFVKLYPSGGTAEGQICNSTGTQVYASGIYPLNPLNPNRTTCNIDSGTYRYVYVKSLSTQVWGNAEYGIE